MNTIWNELIRRARKNAQYAGQCRLYELFEDKLKMCTMLKETTAQRINIKG